MCYYNTNNKLLTCFPMYNHGELLQTNTFKNGLEQIKCHVSYMLTVVTAAVVGRSCSAGNKADTESGPIIVGEYSKRTKHSHGNR